MECFQNFIQHEIALGDIQIRYHLCGIVTDLSDVLLQQFCSPETIFHSWSHKGGLLCALSQPPSLLLSALSKPSNMQKSHLAQSCCTFFKIYCRNSIFHFEFWIIFIYGLSATLHLSTLPHTSPRFLVLIEKFAEDCALTTWDACLPCLCFCVMK